MTTENTVIVSASLIELRAFGAGSFDASRKASKASEHLVLAAILGADHFEDTVKAFYAEIRANERGLAKKVGAESAKDGDGYTVPGSIRAQVSQVLRAVRFGVDLGTADAPRGITDIRKDTGEAAEAAEAAKTPKELTADDALRMALVDGLSDAIKAVKGAEGTVLESIKIATLEYVGKVLAIQSKAEAAKAMDKAETEAKAAPTAGGMLPNGKAARRTRSEAVAAAA